MILMLILIQIDDDNEHDHHSNNDENNYNGDSNSSDMNDKNNVTIIMMITTVNDNDDHDQSYSPSTSFITQESITRENTVLKQIYKPSNRIFVFLQEMWMNLCQISAPTSSSGGNTFRIMGNGSATG